MVWIFTSKTNSSATVILAQLSTGWVHGELLCESTKTHPLLKPYKSLAEKVRLTPFTLRKDYYCFNKVGLE